MPVAYAYTPYIWPMFVSAAFAAAIGLYTWRHRTVPGATAFAAHELGVALWALFTGIEIAAVTLPTKVVYHKLEGMSALLATGAALQFALERASSSKQVIRRSARLLAAGAFGLLILMLTNELHHLLWTGFWFDGFVRVGRGPLNPFVVAYALLPPIIGAVIFARLFLVSRGISRWQALMLAVGGILPILTYLLEPAGINPIAPLDPVIIMWNVSGALYALAIFGFGLLSVVPVGRDMAIERMARGMLILDTEDRIVDLNPAAVELLTLARHSAIGRPSPKALAAHPRLLELLATPTAASVELVLPEPDAPRYVQAQATPLTQPGGFPLGRLILLQDVTEQHQAQTRALELQWAEAVRQEREQLAQELHDSLSQSLGFLSLQSEATLLQAQHGRGEEVQAGLTRLAQVSREMQSGVRELIGGLLTVSEPSDGFCSALRQVVARFAEQTGLSVALEIPDQADAYDATVLPPAAAIQLLRIAQEALANVRQHGGRPSLVHVRLATHDGQLRLTVADNGAGFDPVAQPRPGLGHYGLQVMRQRADRIGGKITVASAPGQGTRVDVTAPLRHRPEAHSEKAAAT